MGEVRGVEWLIEAMPEFNCLELGRVSIESGVKHDP